jgi:hypothetical protein
MSDVLELWDIAALEAAEESAPGSMVSSVRIGAHLYSALELPTLMERLGKFRGLKNIFVAEDRIYDADMAGVERKFRDAYPDAHFEWVIDGVLSGKYGR